MWSTSSSDGECSHRIPFPAFFPMTVFDDLKNALAEHVGDAEVAGFILGFSVTMVFFFGMAIALGKESMKGWPFAALMFMVSIFVTGIGWYPLWVPFLMGIVVLLYKFNPFEPGGS